MDTRLPFCYELLDTYDMTVIGEFWTQDKAMQDLYNIIRLKGTRYAGTINLLHIDDNEEITLMCYGNEQRIVDWYRSLEKLTIELQLTCGTSPLGLAEFIQYAGYNPEFSELHTPMNQLDMKRYLCWLTPQEGEKADLPIRSGATKLEALAKAFIQETKWKNAMK